MNVRFAAVPEIFRQIRRSETLFTRGTGEAMRSFCPKKIFAAIFILFALCGCKYALQRGMVDNSYISTARPAIAVAVNNLPLMTSGQGMASLDWSDMLGGLNIQMWMAVYGAGGLAPLAIVAQANVPQGWYWDGILYKTFSVDQNIENFGGVGYQVCTFIVNPQKSPFGGLVTGIMPDGQPQLWIARYMAARYNFNDSKIILQYMEPLPAGISSLDALPMGMGDFLRQFEQRARDAFTVQNNPEIPAAVSTSYIQGIRWTLMGSNFLGSASKYNLWAE